MSACDPDIPGEKIYLPAAGHLCQADMGQGATVPPPPDPYMLHETLMLQMLDPLAQCLHGRVSNTTLYSTAHALKCIPEPAYFGTRRRTNTITDTLTHGNVCLGLVPQIQSASIVTAAGGPNAQIPVKTYKRLRLS